MKQISKFKKGFTLIELLVVITVVGVLAGAVIVIINPAAILDRAGTTKGKSFQSQLMKGPLGFYNIGAWNFNEESTPGRDTSGNNLNGTVSGATYIANCNLGLGGCFSFDGSNDYISIPNPPVDDFGSTSSMSVAAWIKVNQLTAESIMTIVDNKIAGTNSPGFNLQVATNDGSVFFRIANGAAQTAINPSQSSVADGKWHHFVGVLTRGASFDVLSLYKDGVLIGSMNHTAGWNITSAGAIFIGAYSSNPTNANFFGQIDEVYLFNQSLSQARIQQMYAQGLVRKNLASTVR